MTVSMAPTKPARSSLASASLRYSEIRAGSRYSSKSSLLDIRVLSSGHFRKLVWYMGDRIGLESGYAGCTVSRFPVRISNEEAIHRTDCGSGLCCPGYRGRPSRPHLQGSSPGGAG